MLRCLQPIENNSDVRHIGTLHNIQSNQPSKSCAEVLLIASLVLILLEFGNITFFDLPEYQNRCLLAIHWKIQCVEMLPKLCSFQHLQCVEVASTQVGVVLYTFIV